MRVLVLSEFYLPAFRAGGPVRTLVNLVQRLGDEIDFGVVTGDRDLGDNAPFSDVPTGEWVLHGGHSTFHLPSGWRSVGGLARALRREPYDLLYLNSLFSRRFGIAPVVLRALRLLPARPLVVAPRGELSPGALGLNRGRKRAFLRFARGLDLYRGVRWQASSEYEAADIRAGFGDVEVMVAPNLVAARRAPVPRADKQADRLCVAFFSRIVPMKNLLMALELVDGLEGEIALDIYGPVEDDAYWARCRARVAQLAPNVVARHLGPVPFGAASTVLAGYDALLLPTLGENFGHVILEAFAAGCPVVVSDMTPWRNLEEKGIGWDLPLQEPDRFRGALTTLVAMGPEEHGRLSRAAQAYALAISGDEATLDANRRLFASP